MHQGSSLFSLALEYCNIAQVNLITGKVVDISVEQYDSSKENKGSGKVETHN